MSVRVRFAPSPTGWLHVGGARTAYFNWLFARQREGKFVVRIEDTDVARSSAESETGVLRDLAWLGLDPDEGPVQGGEFGPYRQSERHERGIYRGIAGELVRAGLAYPCFCTDEELEARRKAALAAGRPPHYDGRCRRLTAAERERRLGGGEPASVRFEVPAREWVLADLVRGEVRFPAGMVGDFVLLRANGLPTYNFACVADDHAMRISHVIRAEEHLANTPRQLMLYDALGYEPPLFAHVPLILNTDRTKMSKRTGEAAVAVGDWRRDGIVPEALLSYLALLGFHPGDDREVLTREELVEAFSLSRIGVSGSVFDAAKLRWMNAHYLHHATGGGILGWLERETRAGRAPGEAAPDWLTNFRALAQDIEPPRLEAALEILHGNLASLADVPVELECLVRPVDYTTLEPEAATALAAAGGAELCIELAAELGTLAVWNADGFKSALQRVGGRLGRKGKALYQPVRAALTGRTHGPELPLVAEWLGGDLARTRLEAAAAWSRAQTNPGIAR